MTKEQTEQFAEFWKGKVLTSIDFYNHHKEYVFFGERMLLVDGAAELRFGDEFITVYFNLDKEMFDTSSRSVSELYKGEEYYQIQDDAHIDRSLIGQEVVLVEPFWASFTPRDEDGHFLPEVDYFLEELILQFGNSRQLQLATVDYQLIHGKLENVRISFSGEIMVNVGDRITIV